ncbi:MAG TPA: HNH endonuclease signature motif containing protein [Verrucomicrobiae bacterium]|nr:HNH endonuclease signature motif containing protein [Verrucomicrobiae bacterium]
MTGTERAAHCRRIGALGGRRTLELYGTSYLSAIGKTGFRVALELGYGEVLSHKLAGSYQAKFGREIRLSPQSKEAARIRAEARKRAAAGPCVRCGAGKTEVHHRRGISDPDANHPNNLVRLCSVCHRAEHRRRRAAHRQRGRQLVGAG